MSSRLNNVVPPAGAAFYLENSSIYKMVSKISKNLRNINHQPEVEREFILLRDMIDTARGSRTMSENTSDKLLRQHFDIALADLEYKEKLDILNKCYNAKYEETGTGTNSSTVGRVFSTLADVVACIIDYLNDNNMLPFKDNEFVLFKQAYNNILQIYPGIDKVVNGNLKNLWSQYKDVRDHGQRGERVC